ncbi:DegV family protein [Macrococcus carouselicus]|uniref:DegV family protein n=1 Tax=Macrococcus carouselicus TaxID=69969 RepID=A0A9Q8CKW8_9STAP|nr:DegV family protein [Macrococcus carouselicus]TDM02457.1 DegV family protein [Macrococcus carouselicus]
MEKIAFMTDSASGFGLTEHPDVFVVPMGVIVNDQEYVDYRDIQTHEFYDLLKDYGNGAKTFQPSPQSFHDTYQKIVDNGYTHVIAIHATKELTGTYQSSEMTSREFDIESTVINSNVGDYPLRRMVEEGVRLSEAGESYAAIVTKVKEYAEEPSLIIYPKNLQQLKNSGRVSRSQGIIAGLLNIQLIIEFEDGKLYPIEKIRSKKKALNFIHNKITKEITEDNPSKIGVSYAGEHEEADLMVEWLKDRFPDKTIEKHPLVHVAGVHTGYGTIAIGWIKA